MLRLSTIYLALTVCTAAPAHDTSSVTQHELEEQYNALIAEGFNFTNPINLNAAGQSVRVDLLIPPPAEPHQLRLWVFATGGEATVRITSPGDNVLESWQGSAGRIETTISFPAGRNSIELDGNGSSSVAALVGVKGPVSPSCRPDPADISIHTATASSGFRWPYLLFLPDHARSGYLLVVPNNTGFSTTDSTLLSANGLCEIQKSQVLAEGLGSPLLVPLFPRPSVDGEEENLYLHALSRASLLAKDPAYARVDLQLIAMLEDARRVLAAKDIPISPRVMLAGFSAAGSYASRFAMLHPDHVLAVAAGSPGGWPIIPEVRHDGSRLAYPVGIGDLRSLVGQPADLTALRDVAWFYYLGGHDHNDSVIFRDSFSKADEKFIFDHFGKDLSQRFEAAAHAYRAQGMIASFRVFPEDGHVISDAMQAGVKDFFVSAMKHADNP